MGTSHHHISRHLKELLPRNKDEKISQLAERYRKAEKETTLSNKVQIHLELGLLKQYLFQVKE